MNTFHDSLLAQYRELIHEAIVESEFDHKTKLDLNILTQKLRVVMQAALVDGISHSEVSDLIREAQHHHLHQFLAA